MTIGTARRVARVSLVGVFRLRSILYNESFLRSSNPARRQAFAWSEPHEILLTGAWFGY